MKERFLIEDAKKYAEKAFAVWQEESPSFVASITLDYFTLPSPALKHELEDLREEGEILAGVVTVQTDKPPLCAVYFETAKDIEPIIKRIDRHF